MCKKKFKKGLFLYISLLRVNFGDLMMESGLKKGNKLINTDPISTPIYRKCMENY